MIDPGLLIRQAKAETGLSDWGQGPSVERWLDLLLKDCNRINLPEALDGYVRGRLHSALTTRLRLAVVQPKPMPLKQRPLYILGLTRSGTTFLQELLGQQPGWRALTLTEALYPLEVAAGKASAARALNKTREFCKAVADSFPKLAAMHNYAPDGVEENHMLMEPSFMTYSLCTPFSAPNYVAAFDKADKTEAWKVLLRLLNALSDQRKWVLKDPRQAAFVGSFLATIPCDVVWIRRDPLSAIPSACSMLSEIRDMPVAERSALGPKVLESTRKTILAINKAMENYPRLLRIDYEELVSQPLKTAEKIVAFTGDSFESSSMEVWLKQNSRSRPAKHSYSAEEFGLTPEAITQSLAGIW